MYLIDLKKYKVTINYFGAKRHIVIPNIIM